MREALTLALQVEIDAAQARVHGPAADADAGETRDKLRALPREVAVPREPGWQTRLASHVRPRIADVQQRLGFPVFVIAAWALAIALVVAVLALLTRRRRTKE